MKKCKNCPELLTEDYGKTHNACMKCLEIQNTIKFRDKIRSCLTYDPDTGSFTWLKNIGDKIKKGDAAGCKDSYGYIVIGFDGKGYKAHRLAYLLMTGFWPKDQIDHVNGHKEDNSWKNIRESTSRQNSRNQKINSRNTSGYKGVSLEKSTGKWKASIRIEGDRKYLGCFKTKEAAAFAYNEAALKYHKEFSRLNDVDWELILDTTSKVLTLLRMKGCECRIPLFGWRPNFGPKCRLCNVEAKWND
jgi:hypothetical protein